ncbi:uncharacterized protein LACBIDRAFT_310939 [Laccaria bicolor S238N-H82]|uniref:Predicted protein n=1 Tax=Laccaria bicolor (strain S238N-H82 / ATCC MYA-4686) TaxID=486041 RepID=B0E4Y3_LACBS|nr:uncharacterized protein LACBIDRAFT_310939 [Laccaria bicolor S238N-H82]EDQ98098.1 predicted protein [Laccaria bicolor S238N-H82]|eukprot:XP_001891251.1 predicted protein [Laccaria bicolor S238N-H82]
MEAIMFNFGVTCGFHPFFRLHKLKIVNCETNIQDSTTSIKLAVYCDIVFIASCPHRVPLQDYAPFATRLLKFTVMLLSPASTSASLPAQSFWDTFRPKNKDDMRNKQAQRALARQRLLTLAYGDMETVRMLPNSYAELDAIARDWIKPPPEAVFSLRVPVEYASLHATRWVSGPNIYLTGEDSYQIAVMGVQGLRVEIVSGPPPPPDSDEPP